VLDPGTGYDRIWIIIDDDEEKLTENKEIMNAIQNITRYSAI
jgi:hypothetical protein